MPREDRRIIFDYEEVYKALYALCAQKQMRKPPPGALESVTEKEGEPEKIIIKLVNPSEKFDPEVTVEYNRDFLAAALMLFCRGQGIPLPKSARKSVMIQDGEVMLRARIG